jgi:hypothetical protein
MRLNYAAQVSYHAAAMLSATVAALFTLIADRRVKFRVVVCQNCHSYQNVEIFPPIENTGKTFVQKMKEAEALELIEAERAKNRMLAAQNNKAAVEIFPRLPTGENTGKTRDKVAQQNRRD